MSAQLVRAISPTLASSPEADQASAQLAALVESFLSVSGAAVGSIPFADFKTEVLELYKPPLRARGTFRMMFQVLSIAADVAGPDAMTDVLTPAFVARFIAALPAGENPNTTYGKLSYLRAACSYAESQCYLRTSPFRVRRKWCRRVTPQDRKHHTLEEIARVLDNLRRETLVKQGYDRWYARRLYALVATVAYTGVRRDEALYLRIEDVDLGGRMLKVWSRRARETKTEASAQPVAMPPALVPILGEWLPRLALPRSLEGTDGVAVGWVFPGMKRNGPWTGGSPGYKPLDAVRKAGERVGVKGFTFLSLRHSWGTHAERWGLSDAQIQRQLRHTNTVTQWHYRHAEASNMRQAVDRVDFGPAPETP